MTSGSFLLHFYAGTARNLNLESFFHPHHLQFFRDILGLYKEVIVLQEIAISNKSLQSQILSKCEA